MLTEGSELGSPGWEASWWVLGQEVPRDMET